MFDRAVFTALGVVACGGGSPFVGQWDLLSTTSADGATGCMEVEEDLSGVMSTQFASGAVGVSTLAVTEVDETHCEVRFDTDPLPMACTLAGDDLHCEIPFGTNDLAYTLEFRRGDCTPAEESVGDATLEAE